MCRQLSCGFWESIGAARSTISAGERLTDRSGGRVPWLTPPARCTTACNGYASRRASRRRRWPSDLRGRRACCVDTLIEQRFAVFALNPKQLDRFRDRLRPEARRTIAAMRTRWRMACGPIAARFGRCSPMMRRSFTCGNCAAGRRTAGAGRPARQPVARTAVSGERRVADAESGGRRAVAVDRSG